ncbi:virion protein US2 [Cervid alphaherpesvirus 3]|uniref:Virion protein US2 n=1 Tax=Cervid alphaherpesvirus 3 TaxID=2115790 RepID=A0A455JKY3_9ALPH|nr:virion protein US2 [Cervid alphaherpesvirus 3]AVT50648.1 virion protein US2 [Cervid alphaherpesvirus 3]
MVTVVTCADRRGRFPWASADVPAQVWRFLAEQCRALAAGRLGTPVVVFDRALLWAAADCAPAPPARVAYVDTAPLARARARRPAPPPPPGAAEWVSAVDGYNLLNSGRAGARPFHLWVFGAADLYAPVFAHVAAAPRLVYARLDRVFAGATWRLPRRGPAIASAWPPYETPALSELRAGGVLLGMAYEVADRAAAPGGAAPGGRGAAPPGAPCSVL